MSTKTESMDGWWSRIDRNQKFVFVVATLAWMFDCLDQQLFNLARSPAMASLLEPGQDPKYYGGLSTSIFVLGWATGGMIFGSLGDRYGRARMLAVTVLLYSLATGLSALSVHFADFAAYRFITGLGVGGVFGLSVALVADSLPDVVRPRALGVLQSLSAVGNVSAGLIGMGVAALQLGAGSWKWLFLIGALPAMLTAFIQFRLKEPEKWVVARARAEARGHKAGSYRVLFKHPVWRRHALLGMLLSCAGVVGLWGIGVFSNDMVGDIVAHSLGRKPGITPEQIQDGKKWWMSINLLCFNGGAFFGMMAFTRVAEALGRRKAFAGFYVGALVVTVFVFQKLNTTTDILWMAPLMGFFQLSVFAGMSIYLPELFPTSLRSTGTSFCYNVGRYLAATGPFTLGLLAANLARSAEAKAVEAAGAGAAQAVVDAAKVVARIDAFRDAASIMCVIFLLGLVVLPFLPETKGQPLPEED